VIAKTVFHPLASHGCLVCIRVDSSAAMLCTACERIFDTSPKRSHPRILGQYIHHDSSGKIEGAAAAGCQLCSIIWDRFTGDEKLRMHTRILKKDKPLGRLQSPGQYLRWGLVRICWWALNRHLMQPAMKQFHQAEDFDLYGWSADLDKGIVGFIFGTHGWKVVSLILSPCKGPSMRGCKWKDQRLTICFRSSTGDPKILPEFHFGIQVRR
jgi:hypothetical protein